MISIDDLPKGTPRRIRQEFADLAHIGHSRPGLYATQARRIVDFIAEERGLRRSEFSRIADDLIEGIFEAMRENGEIDIEKRIEPKVTGFDLYSMAECFAPSGRKKDRSKTLLGRMNCAVHSIEHDIGAVELSEIDDKLFKMACHAYEPNFAISQKQKALDRIRRVFRERGII